ncbi:hypothetical protein J7E50_19545 [Pedobacter sp. ISL-68]|uniref:hypothetical protein n=1 Tax=unclassified Pedobacter TaxID=2628915 RepID=UPI001BE53AEE|nr:MULTISPECIES: hypothetical protein [unclassified Pedobacter]MBT2564689.1 hypothetical protein [Pedobacter sp. ISL-64]MBT2592422.1 hypothetical protein [Pedobacter sp. ISL-68]
MTAAFIFPGLKYPSSDLIKYLNVLNDFSLVLKNGDIIKFAPDDEQAFLKWLNENNIQNIRKDEGWIIQNQPS